MTFEEWSNKKKKKQENEGVSSPSASTQQANTETSTRPSFSEWSNKKLGKTTTTKPTITVSSEGLKGYQKYLDDIEINKAAAQEQQENEKWWEKLGRYLAEGNTTDTSLPGAALSQAVTAAREDVSYKRPSDDWSDEQKAAFGELYLTDPEKAFAYAEEANNLNNKAKEEAAVKEIQKSATSSFGAGLANTLGSIAAAPLGLADYLNDLVMANAGRDIVPDGTVSPFEYSQAVQSGVSTELNEKYGTLDEDIPVIGGKGLGDVYGLGTSIAQSAASGYTLGPVGTLVAYFGQASAAGVDDAMRRGATEDQAILYGAMLGIAEGGAEMIGVDNLFKISSSSTLKELFKNVIKQAGAEGIEEGLTSIANNLADAWIMQDKSNFSAQIQQYMSAGMSESEAKKRVFWDSIEGIAYDMLGGFVSGGVHAGVQTAIQTGISNSNAKKTYGDGKELVNESLEIDPNNAFAQKLQGKLNQGKTISGGEISRLVEQNESAIETNDVIAIREAAEKRLTALGETGDVYGISLALAKQAAGDKLTRSERTLIENSRYGHSVARELNPENIRSMRYSTEWAEKIGTDRINAEEYSRLIASMEAEDANNVVADTNVGSKTAEVAQNVGEALPVNESTANVENVTENATADKTAKTGGIEAVESAGEEAESSVTLEDASRKYGAQAGAMIHTYTEGQDVAKYDAAYQAAYDMGKAGVALSYAMNSESTAYLSESQRELAHATGAEASSANAKEQDAKNKAAVNGKTGRRKGAVKGEGVTIADIKKIFNDTQGTAYKLLSTYADATGVDIVLFRSVANADGNFEGAQGRFKWSEDTIYIDVNAGLANIKSVDDLAKYTMLRTFAHEFTHFIEKWNPIQYNEFRKVVFDTLTERGENVHDLIEAKQAASDNMTYDQASREVVAEAMTDILPDANFVETLATKHKTIFGKLLEQLKAFVSRLREYYNTIGHNRSREANALKEQVGESVKYVESIVALFDRVAVEAVENYQATVATEETTTEAEGKKPTDFETAFWNASQEERDEVVEAINQNTKISHMMPTEIRGEKPTSTVEEVKTNVENEDNRGAAQQSVTDRQGDPRVLDEVETGDVPRDGGSGDALADAGERGQQTSRDDNRADAAGTRRRSSKGSRKSADLRRDDGLTDTATDTNVGDKAAQLHEEVTEQIAQQSTELPKGRNFVIGDSLDLPSGEKARYKANVEAIRLVKQLEAEGRYATEAEQVVLSKYVGWGGIANAFDARKADWAKEYAELKELLTDEEYASARGSTLNAHYTDISVIKAMYDGLAGLGFNGGRMMEPSSGVGNFVGAMPTAMASKVKSWTMVELDGITGLIAKYLYPNADVRIQGFEKANIPDNYMDVAISNVPFGNYPIADKAYPKRVTSAIHNYFFAKSLDKVRPGGIVMFITSSYTMNSKDNAVRRYIMQRADLLGAIRLPSTAFKGNAGTEVVTDILVLKKRAANTAYAGEDFLEAPWQYPVKGNYSGANINSYFDAHPEMVLGTPSMEGGMYRGGSLTYKPLEGKGSLADQIREAFSHIEGKMDYPATLSREKTNFAVERAGKKTKENGLVVKDGKVYQNKNGELVEQTVAKGAADRISSMLEIRDAARELMTYQQQGLKESEIKKARTKLTKLYDAFVKKYGYLNAQANKNAIKADPDCYSIYALENWNPDTKKATKADIFSKNTIAPNRTVTAAKDVAEGLIVSVNQTGGVDVSLIAKLTGKTDAEVTRELIDSRRAFKNRDGELEAAEVYLSGNVRAKLRDAEALVSLDSDYQNNVEALRSVMPEDVGYQDIFVNPGTPWIPSSVYSDFAAYMLGGRNTEWRQAVDVTRNPETGNFTVELKERYYKTNAANTQKWGTPRRTFLELFDAMLNSKSVVIKDKLSDGSTVVNKDATAAANEKIENIQKEFQEWLWKDETRRAELATLYNETFNSIVTPKYNGDNLTVNGANANKPLRPHQRNAVQRVISSGGNTLLAHKVGAGKTYEMAAAAMKLKELGLVKKPMFAVPKSLVAQWGVEFKDFFPTAKLLVAEASDFTAANRKVFMNRIANGEYDAVILSYEQFEKLPMSDDFTRDLYQEQIDSVVAAIEEAKAEKGDKALSIKDLEKKRKSLQAKIDKLTDKAKDEDNIDFEQLGVDSLFVDEAHNFKNLFYTTSMTNVSGLGNKDGSKRAFDLYTKVRYLQQLNGGRGIVFATATPVMNSMSEMYIMQKYLQPDLLDQLGLSTFDAWAKQFGEVVNGVEIKPSGQGYRVKQSFSRFKNMSELQLLFRNFADVLTDIPGLKIPKMKGGKVSVVVCEPGQFQQDYMKELEQRADNIKNVDPSVDNMLKITSDGRKISYTQRMIDPSLPYEEGCKIYRCADNVVKAYNESADIKGTQLIFCDMATPKGKSNTNTTETEDLEMDMESAQLYDDIKARLREGGIPAKEIAFIHEADTDQKKKKLFADVNDGKVRVLIGSTGKMGVGMNAQKRVVAIHHLDAPWRPGDVEQRNGRAFRQGNINDEVECFTYVTEGSFDARLWDILERKQNFINQVMNGESVGRETEDTGEVTLSAAEVKALASGSPLIMEQVQLDTDIKKLESLYRSHVSAVRSAKERLERDKGEIATLEKRIAAGRADVAARVDTYSEGKFSITIGKAKYTDKKEAGVALMAEATAKATEDGYTEIGRFAGFKLSVVKTKEGISGLIIGRQGYPFKTYPGNTTFMISHLVADVEGISEKVKLWEHTLTETQADMAEQEKLIDAPFAKQAELDQKRARYNEVMEILNPKEEQSLDTVAEDTVQEQSRAYLEDDYSTDGVHWGIEAGIMSTADARVVWEAIANIQKKGYNSYPTTVNGEHFVEVNNMLMVVDADYHNPVIKTIYKFNDTFETNLSYAKEIIKNAKGNPTGNGEALRIIEGMFGEGYVEQHDFEIRRTYERENGGRKGSNSGTGSKTSEIRRWRFDNDEQQQQRTDTLTDREVLAMAASEVNVSDLSAAEQDALRIFRERLSTLQTLQEERAEQGRLYKEQQFGVKVDREAAAQTLNRMHVLDDKIKAASAEVLSVEDKKVLGRVLQKARKVVEAEERKHGAEILSRWRDRTKNAAAIKKYRERIKTDVTELTNWVLKPNNKDIVKHIPDVLKNSVIPFLSSIDLTSKQQLRGGDATRADKEFMTRLNGLKAALKQNIDVSGLYSGYNDLPPNFMDTLQTFIDAAQAIVAKQSGEFVINQMTSDELRDLSNVVRTLKKYITQVNRFHANAMFQHVWEAGDNTIESLGAMNSDGGNANGLSNFVLWQQIRPAFAFERFGEGGKAIYDGLRRGQAQLAFNTKKIVDFAEETYTEAEVNAWEKEIKEIKLGGDTVKMPVSTIMSFYELSKRPQALGHILGQGIRVATVKMGKKKISDIGHIITEGDVPAIIAALTPRQREVADKLQQYMAKQGGAWGNYVSVKRFGEELFGEETYFPIHSDGRHLQSNADESPSAASLYALLNMSFTKALTEKANNRLVLYSIFDVFANHMASMAQYNAMALPVLDALKWFNYQQKTEDEDGNRYIMGSVRDQMSRVYGVPEETRPGSGRQGYAETFVINILKAFNGTEAQGVPSDTIGMNATRRYNMAQVAYNFRVVVQQPLAITRAALLIDYGSIAKGLKLNPKAIARNIEEMREHSGIAAWKSLGFYDVNISRGLTDVIKHNSTVMDKISDVGMWGAEKADTLTWAVMWSACKEEVIKKQRLTPKDAGFYEAVTALFEDVIYKTQVVDSVLTKNEFLRSKGAFARMISSFMSEPTTTASMLVDAYDKYHRDIQRGMTRQQAWAKNRRMIGRVAYVYGLSAVILAAVQAVADAFRDDDDYEEWYEKWLEAFGGNLVDELMPLNKLPIFSDFYDLAKSLLSVLGVDTYGNPPQSVFMQWYDSLVKGVEILYDRISGEDTNYTWYGGIYKLLQAAAGMSGLPMAAATREIITAWNNTVGAMAPSLKVKTYEASEMSEIKYAYADGYLTDEEATALLLEKGLVDNEDEAYFTIQGWEVGEGYSRYDALETAVRTGTGFDAAMQELLAHGYDTEDIYSRVRSKAGEWYRGGEISKAQAVSMLERYTDMTSDKITETVNKWSSVVVTGIEYENIAEEYEAGNISASRAIEMYVRYGGMTQEKAYEKVTVISFVMEHPETEGISYSAIEAYTDYCESYGIEAGVFYDVWKYNSSAKADVDANGDAISGSKKEKVLYYIDSLELSVSQKDSLYYAFGWAESKIYEAPWR